MRKRVWISAASTIVLVVVGTMGVIAANAGPREVTAVRRAETLVVLAEPLKFKTIDVGTDKNSPGDYTMIQERLTDETTGDRVGVNRVLCNVYFGADVCTATFTIKGRGDIVAKGVFANADVVAMAILGGSGDFAGQGGEVTAEFRPDDIRFTFELTP